MVLNKRRLGILLAGIIILLAFLFYQWPVQEEKPEKILNILPQKLGELQLAEYKTGEEALKELSMMHAGSDKLLVLTNGYVARYGDDKGNTAIVWIGKTGDETTAKMLLEYMNQKITNSQVFTGLKMLEIGSKTIYTVQGMGMQHYYYVKNNGVYWIAMNNPQLKLIEEAVREIGY